ncbi:MAG: alpha/beta hydrolase [Pseudorhodoplanes sp.]|nr:alpha/beta hydrolase [Pseudorhodoplanes sp.]
MSNGESVFLSAPDGLKLHARVWGAQHCDSVPVVCLPGLSRNTADFDGLAITLAHDAIRPRRVLALDYRGRGASDYDRDPQNYNLAVELADVIAAVTALDAIPAVYVGTSRGGILTMLLAAARPTLIAGAVLNDIGPVIEPGGLMRIKSYVGKLPEPRSFDEGADILRRLFSAQFPRLTAEEWLEAARQTWRRANGRLVLTYDARLRETLKAVDPEQPPPAMWNQFDALAGIPLMAIRGANSDILSAQTLQMMKARRKDLQTIEVADQGHPPLLRGDLVASISDFVRRCGSLVAFL